ncbi:MAG TPA: alpha/beta hydrolase-fold protein [Burkholderiales bacterium]|nr:alpha/beta hydrolase-fold protein [Burkholderiales bacterium]
MHQPNWFVLVIVIALQAVPARAEQSAFSSRSLTVGGIERSYLVRAPRSALTKRAAVVVMLHGHGGSAAGLVGQGRTRAAPYREWMQIADRENIVLVAPDGLVGSDEKQGWKDCRADATTNPLSDDVGFLVALLATLERDMAIDRRRVFVMGTSNGGHMALRMAIEQPDKIAAVAAIVAAMPANSQCPAPKQFVPVLLMNGTADPLLPYTGGAIANNDARRGSVISTQESIDMWRQLSGASPIPETKVLDDTNVEDRSRVTRLRYLKDGLPVAVLYRIEGGGHAEPSRQERYARFFTRMVGAQNGDIDMAEEVWQFFSAQSQRTPSTTAR